MSMNQTSLLPETETKTFYLGRCKDCEYAARTSAENVLPAQGPSDVYAGAVYQMGARYYTRCPNRHRLFRLHKVEGEYSEAFQCDSRCENARGNFCKCSCGGLNHGRGHEVALDNIQTVEDAAPAPIEPVSNRPGTGYPLPREANAEKVYLCPGYALGEKIEAVGKVIVVKPLSDAVLYVFIVNTDEGEARVAWFCPSYAVPEPDFSVGDIIEFTAKLKRQQDSGYGKETVVTYLEAKN